MFRRCLAAALLAIAALAAHSGAATLPLSAQIEQVEQGRASARPQERVAASGHTRLSYAMPALPSSEPSLNAGSRPSWRWRTADLRRGLFGFEAHETGKRDRRFWASCMPIADDILFEAQPDLKIRETPIEPCRGHADWRPVPPTRLLRRTPSGSHTKGAHYRVPRTHSCYSGQMGDRLPSRGQKASQGGEQPCPRCHLY